MGVLPPLPPPFGVLPPAVPVPVPAPLLPPASSATAIDNGAGATRAAAFGGAPVATADLTPTTAPDAAALAIVARVASVGMRVSVSVGASASVSVR